MDQSHYADSKSECIVYEKAHCIIETLISLIYRLNLVSYLIHIRSVPCSGKYPGAHVLINYIFTCKNEQTYGKNMNKL